MSKFDIDENTFISKFAENLKVAFKNMKETERFTQVELGKQAGNIPQSAISKYLKGDALPNVYDMCKLASALNVSINYLCGLDESDKIEDEDKNLLNFFARIIEDKYKVFVSINCTNQTDEALDETDIWHPDHDDYIFRTECFGDESDPNYEQVFHKLALERMDNPKCRIIISSNVDIINDFIREYTKVYEGYKAVMLNVTDEEIMKQVYDTTVSAVIEKYSKILKKDKQSTRG